MDGEIKEREFLSHAAFDCSPAEPDEVAVGLAGVTTEQHFTSLCNEGT